MFAFSNENASVWTGPHFAPSISGVAVSAFHTECFTVLLESIFFALQLTHLSFPQTGFLAACPYLLKSILGPLGGISADMLIKYKILSIGSVRKIFYAVGE